MSFFASNAKNATYDFGGRGGGGTSVSLHTMNGRFQSREDTTHQSGLMLANLITFAHDEYLSEDSIGKMKAKFLKRAEEFRRAVESCDLRLNANL